MGHIIMEGSTWHMQVAKTLISQVALSVYKTLFLIQYLYHGD